MPTNAAIGYGSTFGIGDDLSPPGYDTLAEVVSITPFGYSRGAVDVTTMDSTSAFREFVAGLTDPGEVSLELNFVPGTAAASTLLAEFDDRNVNEYRITFPDTSTFDFDGFCTGFSTEDPIDDKMSATATYKITGKPVLTQA